MVQAGHDASPTSLGYDSTGSRVSGWEGRWCLRYMTGVGGRSSAACSSAEKVLLQPTEDCVFTTLGINSHLFACTRDSYEALVRTPSPILAGNKSWLAGRGLSFSLCHRVSSSSDPTCYQVPLPEEIQVSPGDTEIHRVEPEDVANHLTAFHWELFRCVHEVGPEFHAGQGVWHGMCSGESAFAAKRPPR